MSSKQPTEQEERQEEEKGNQEEKRCEKDLKFLREKIVEIEDTTKKAIGIYYREQTADKLVNTIFWQQVYPKMKANRHHIRLTKDPSNIEIWDYVLTEFYRRGFQIEINHQKTEQRSYDCTIRWE